MSENKASINFEFLKERFKNLYSVARESENLLTENHYIASCIESRKFLEKILDYLCIKFDIPAEKLSIYQKIENEDLQNNLDNPKKICPLMHEIRLIGNGAAHGKNDDADITFEIGLKALNKIYNLAVWFYKFEDPCFKYYEPFRDPSCSSTMDCQHNNSNNKKIALAKVMAAYTNHFIDKKKVSNQSSQTTNEITDKAKEFSVNIDAEEKISLKDVFSQYNLTKDQNELIGKLPNFLKKNGENVFLLKGYAGTGKTFITKGLVEYLNAIGRTVVLLAPTGKAAKVLSEKALYPASTIHSCIYLKERIEVNQFKEEEGTDVYKFYFKLKENEFSTDTVFIVDEASMISDDMNFQETVEFGSGKLLRDLFSFINIDHNDHNKKIIFIGDPAQLPPVNRDKKNNESPALSEEYLTNKYNVTVSSFTLSGVVRQKANSLILTEATCIRNAINNKVFNSLRFHFNNKEISRIEQNDFLSCYENITHGNISKDLIVLAYTNDEVFKLNNRIRQLIINHKKNYNEEIDSIPSIIPGEILLIRKTTKASGVLLRNGELVDILELEGEKERFNIPIKLSNANKTIQVNVPLEFQNARIQIQKGENLYELRCKLFLTYIYQYKYFKESFSSPVKDKTREQWINQAMLIFFRMRNKGIDPKKDPYTFNKCLENDEYFNAVRVSFGYALTCHKAQGSEWQDVIVEFSSTNNQFNEDFFRWTYTAITRTSKNLYLINPPVVSVTSRAKII